MTTAQILIASIKEWAMENYENGGDQIVECFGDSDILENFKTLADAKKYCKARKSYGDEIRATIW